ncbi:myosin-10-like [Montipora foliosa]|uniref:myosin-10-like n=1 Tax=Montipora foliosa TaxID=591990 RepID=UPI0035F13835
MSVDGEHGEAMDDEENRIESLKQPKAKDKKAFTNNKDKLLSQMLCEVQERTMSTLDELSGEYLRSKEKEKCKKLTDEMDRLEAEFSEAYDKAQEYLDNQKGELSSLATDTSENTRQRRIEERVVRKSVERQALEEQVKREQDIARQREDLAELHRQYRSRLFNGEELQDLKESEIKGPETRKIPTNNWAESSSTPSLGKDMWNQLMHVSIPISNGDKRLYEGWKMAFMACVDKAPATPEYKLLQLRQYLSGEALRVMEPLGHSAAAYETANERLERKFGSKRRQIALHLEELENFKPLRPGNARDLERLADLLDVTVVNLREACRHDELGSGSLYLSCKKLTEAMLAHYHRWIHENGRWQSVETLRQFIIQEAEFQTVASETIHGLRKRGHKKDSGVTFFGNTQKSSAPQRRVGFRPCKVCSGYHGVSRCDKFKAMSPPARRETAKSLKLCYRCLGGDRNGETYVRSRVCAINNCKNTHNRLLHRDSALPD